MTTSIDKNYKIRNNLQFEQQYKMFSSLEPHGCPCGYFGDLYHNCTCSPAMIQKYISKISGPLLDRVDIHIEVPSLPYKELISKATGEPSVKIRDRVNKARKSQIERYSGHKNLYCNAQLTQRDLKKYCVLDSTSENLLKLAIEKFGLSARAYSRILKVSRTIADIEGAKDISSAHISEAIQYRTLDRKYWLR